MERTGFTSCPFFCWEEGSVRIKYFGDEVGEVVHELVLDLGNVGNGSLAENQGWVVVVSACVLNKEQTGTDGTDSIVPFKNVLARRSSSCGMFS